MGFKDPDFEGLIQFLVEENSFSQERVERYIERLKKAKSKTKQQTLSSFLEHRKLLSRTVTNLIRQSGEAPPRPRLARKDRHLVQRRPQLSVDVPVSDRFYAFWG